VIDSAAVRKRYLYGTHRAVAPEETIARLAPLLPHMGITRVAHVTGLDCVGLPVVMVCRPNARGLSVAQGKGISAAAAEASGLMEAVEAFHAEHVRRPLLLASYSELSGVECVVDPYALPRTAASLFHPDRRLLWIEGRDLLNDEPVWLPYELVHGDYTLPFPTGTGYFTMSSNGLASGNHMLEAMSHAICEAVERDAGRLWDLWSVDRQQRSRIDLSTVDEPGCLQVIERFDRAAVDVAVWEMTSDIGIPAFFCIAVERREDPLRPLSTASGKGCHPDRAVALLRALTEAAQTRLTQIAGSRDDIARSSYEAAHRHDTFLQHRAYLQMQAPPKSFSACPSEARETFDEDVAWALDRLRHAGIARVVAVDLRHPELDIPVVRVVIPGLEGPAVISGLLPGTRACALNGAGT
jgi:ribosomal protein S12 methylthiotransferase accessory factor